MPCRPPPFNINGIVLSAFTARGDAAAQGLDLKCTSWYRTPAENWRVGGHLWSQHQVGWAADVVGPQDDLQTFAKRSRMFGLVAVDEGDHVHIQALPAGVLQRLFGV